MKIENLPEVVKLAAEVGHVFVATASPGGRPHVAAARRLALSPNDHLAVMEWFCWETIRNLHSNGFLSIIVWDAVADRGYQVVGEVEKQTDIDMLNGYIPGKEPGPALPQVERELFIHVDRITEFKLAPHSDT